MAPKILFVDIQGTSKENPMKIKGKGKSKAHPRNPRKIQGNSKKIQGTSKDKSNVRAAPGPVESSARRWLGARGTGPGPGGALGPTAAPAPPARWSSRPTFFFARSSPEHGGFASTCFDDVFHALKGCCVAGVSSTAVCKHAMYALSEANVLS